MLKKILFFIFLLAAFLGFTQIPNASFESVISGKPAGWNPPPTYSYYPIRDTSAAYAGSHAVALYGSVPPAYNGALAKAFPQVSSLPTALTGWYKFYPEGGDSLVFNLGIWAQGDYANAAHNTFTSTILTGTTSVYTQFSVPIDYTGYTSSSCDSAYIIIYPTGNVSYGGYNWTHPNTIAILDDLSWTMVTTGVSAINTDVLLNAESVSPNPSANVANIIYTVSQPATVSLKLYDMTGKQVLSVIDHERQGKGRYKAVADVSGLQAGVYLYEFTTAEGYKVVNKLVKQ